MLSESEKEKLILDLHKQGKSYRDIAEQTHTSFSTIKLILDEKQSQEKKTQMKSIEIKSLRLFLCNKKPIEVAIKLKISTEDAINYYDQFLQLKGFSKLTEIYHSLKSQLSEFIRFFQLSKELKMSLYDISNALQYGNMLPKLKNMIQDLQKEIHDLESNKSNLIQEMDNIQQNLSLKYTYLSY